MNELQENRREETEDLLETARVAQAEFWRSLRDLESLAGVEIESTIDLRDLTLEHLLDPKARQAILGLPELQSGSTI